MSERNIADFALPATGNATFKLSDQRGRKVVVYFYPKDNTPGCTTEGEEFRDLYPAFQAADTVVVGVSRGSFYGLSLPPDSRLPDIAFFVCGGLIGGAGGAMYAASRTLMARHSEPERAGEAFGLFALTGRATAFLAPALIAAATAFTGSVQWGFFPVILLFLAALWLLGFTRPEGDRAP